MREISFQLYSAAAQLDAATAVKSVPFRALGCGLPTYILDFGGLLTNISFLGFRVCSPRFRSGFLCQHIFFLVWGLAPQHVYFFRVLVCNIPFLVLGFDHQHLLLRFRVDSPAKSLGV